MKKIIFILSLLIGSSSYAVNPNSEYMEFFKKYEKSSNSVDPNLIDLYSDDAKISITTKSNDGMENNIKMTGKKMKEMYVANLENLRKLAYTSKYNNLNITHDKKNIRIKASRYDNEKCYTDNDYYMVVTRNVDEKLYITEEYLTIPQKNLCKTSIKDDLALQLSLHANIVRNKLPLQVDRETNLESITAQDKELTMVFRFIHFTENDFSKEQWEMNVAPQLIQNVCKDISMRERLDKGAQLNFKVYYSDYTPITDIKMTKQDCSI